MRTLTVKTPRKPRTITMLLAAMVSCGAILPGILMSGALLCCVTLQYAHADDDPAATKRQIDAVKSQIQSLNQSIRTDQNK